LNSYLAGEGLPLERSQLRLAEDGTCHLVFRPTLTGFQADPDDHPVVGLFADLDLMSFLAGRSIEIGDSLDILTTVLEQVPEPLEVSVGVDLSLPESVYREPLALRLPGNGRHRFVLRDIRSDRGDSWPQDYLKSGRSGTGTQFLVPRRLFEGSPEKAATFQPVIDGLPPPGFVKSKLSWEGGDLLVVEDPRQSGRRLLLYGNTAFHYWGRQLTVVEYGWVLSREFGADEAVDLSYVPGHLDNFLAFLPASGLALVSRPLTQDSGVACGAVQALEQLFDGAVPAEVGRLEGMLCGGGLTPSDLKAEEIRSLIAEVRRSRADWSFDDPGLRERLDRFFLDRCGSPVDGSCVEHFYRSTEGRLELLRAEPVLLREWVETNLVTNSGPSFVDACLTIIEAQMRKPDGAAEALSRRIAAQMEALGFKVAFVPALPGVPGDGAWPGISYVNSVLIGNRLFVPRFGLGEAENALFERIQNRIPSEIRVTPVYARYALLRNGGVHCSLGLKRSP